MTGATPDGTPGATPDEAAEWHRIAEERRRQLERLQGQPLYRVAASVVARGRRVARSVRRTADPARDAAVLLGRSVLAAPDRLRAPARLAAVRTAVDARPAPDHGGPGADEVTAVIVSAGQPQRLDVLLAALARVGVARSSSTTLGVPATC
jgi:hypothetical protein